MPLGLEARAQRYLGTHSACCGKLSRDCFLQSNRGCRELRLAHNVELRWERALV